MGDLCANSVPPPSTESLQSSSSAAGGPHTIEWVLMSVISTRGLGTPERLKKLEEIRQRKTEHGKAIVTSLTLALRNCYLSPLPKPYYPILLFTLLSGCLAWIREGLSRYTIRHCLRKVTCTYQWHMYTCLAS